jgi:hypothetical protein
MLRALLFSVIFPEIRIPSAGLWRIALLRAGSPGQIAPKQQAACRDQRARAPALHGLGTSPSEARDFLG